MAIVGLDHVQLAMPSGQERLAREFYGELLGLPEVPKPPALAARGGAWFGNDRVRLHVGVDPDFRPARKAHPGLLVEGLADLVARLNGAGYRTESDQSGNGSDSVYVHDPFGNRLELVQARAEDDDDAKQGLGIDDAVGRPRRGLRFTGPKLKHLP